MVEAANEEISNFANLSAKKKKKNKGCSIINIKVFIDIIKILDFFIKNYIICT